MTELTYSVPVIGEENTVACPKVDTALTEIKTAVNGHIDKNNVAAEIPRLPSTQHYEAEKTVTKAEIEAGIELSSTRPAFVVGKFENAVEIGGVKMVGGKAGASESFSYIVPAAQKLKTKAEAASLVVSVLIL